ncbi:MAG: hypothetical protein PQJ59_13610 [Spirochaetales bacterium]|nr:hypothetical protein [Spirochaetales bacterium]
MKNFILIILAAGLFFSCSVKGNLTLDERGAGDLSMDFVLVPFFGDFFTDLIDTDILLDETRLGFEANSAITNHSLVQEDYRYGGTLSFDDFDALTAIDNGEEQTLFVRESSGGITTLTITFTRENWDELSVLVPALSDPTIAMMGPDGSMGLTEEEYREMVIYPFEGYAPSTEEAVKALDASFLEFTVNLPGPVTAQKGGTLKGNSVTYRIPLIRMLMLDEELSYSVSYKE